MVAVGCTDACVRIWKPRDQPRDQLWYNYQLHEKRMNKTGASRVPRSRHVSASKVCLHVTFLPVIYRPQTKFAKVMFLHVSVCPRGGGCGIPACLAGGIPACLAAGLRVGGCIPAWLAGFQAHTQGGGGLEWSGLVGSPGPHPGGSWGVWPGGGVLQAHTLEGWGGSPGPHPGGSPGPHLGGGGIPACTEADPPPRLTATAVGGTHPTGMHSCSVH